MDEDDVTQDRTSLAQDRTLLANERTFAGWVRTGLAAVGIGVGFHVLFREMEPSWIPRGIASLFLVIAVAAVVAAERRACAVMDRLEPHVISSARPMNFRLVTLGVAAGALALIAAIWLVPLR